MSLKPEASAEDSHPFGVPISTYKYGASTTAYSNEKVVHEPNNKRMVSKNGTLLKLDKLVAFMIVLSIVSVGSVAVQVWNILETRKEIERLDMRFDALSAKLFQTGTISLNPNAMTTATHQSKMTRQTSTSMTSTTSRFTTSTLATSIPTAFAFQILQTKNVTYGGYAFLAVQVQLPSDGFSRSENWCRDYQYMCESFSRRPTGCTGYPENFYSPYKDCIDEYNSDMSMEHGLLSCAPDKIADVANMAFPNVSLPARATYNSFGFYQCKPEYCQNTTEASDLALPNMKGFWKLKETDVMYTVCH